MITPLDGQLYSSLIIMEQENILEVRYLYRIIDNL